MNTHLQLRLELAAFYIVTSAAMTAALYTNSLVVMGIHDGRAEQCCRPRRSPSGRTPPSELMVCWPFWSTWMERWSLGMAQPDGRRRGRIQP